MPARIMPVEELRARLERGDPVTVVDTRDEDSRAEWAIPESLAGADADPRALPKDRPIVAVCYHGNSSKGVAARLQSLGFDAYSLEGGMAGWSLAWNVAEIALPTGTTILQVRRTGKGCLSYVVASGDRALVVDASVAPEVYVALCEARGWRIAHVAETHVHADHLSRGRALAERVGAPYHLPANDRVGFPYEAIRDGDVLRVGSAEVRVLATPGHTAESVCYHIDSDSLVTGDTLFLDSVGRPDLEASPDETRARALALHGSLARLFALPPGTRVLPCHVSAPIPFDGAPLVASLAEVRARLRVPLDDARAFADAVLRRIPQTPPNHHVIVEMNEAGSAIPPDVTDLEAGANRCAIG